MREFSKSIYKLLCRIMTFECPKCNGRMKSEMLDMQFDKMVYKCTSCNEQFI